MNGRTDTRPNTRPNTLCERAEIMAESWVTYFELAEVLALPSPEAARQRAIRKRWRRQTGNDGRARVLVDLDAVRTPSEHLSGRPFEHPDEGSDERPAERSPEGVDAEAVQALRDHVETLRGALEQARADAGRERERADTERALGAQERARADQLAAEVLRLTAEAMRASTERDLARERTTRTEADREALAGELRQLRSRPWWRRMVG